MKRTVLITGATSGIGKAIAEAFAKLGHNIVFDSLDKDGAEVARQVAEKYSIEYLFFPVNIADKEADKEMIAQAEKRFGHIDILVNNAGIQHVSPIDEFPDEKWEAIININLSAAFYLTKAVWNGMKRQKFGRIINIASAHGLVASAYKSAYVASKHGIIGFTKAIALEGAQYGITCNAICPGYVHTPIVENQIGDQMKVHNMSREEVIQKIMLDKHAVKEFIKPELIAEATLFLCKESSQPITGIALPVEAGWVAS